MVKQNMLRFAIPFHIANYEKLQQEKFKEIKEYGWERAHIIQEEIEFFSNEEISFEPNYLKKAVDMIENWGKSKDEFSNDFETQLTRWAQLFREKLLIQLNVVI